MTEPWQCPACSVWLAPSVSQHRCDGGQGSVGATVTPILPTGGGSGGATGTITWTGTTVYGADGAWRTAAQGSGALGVLERMMAATATAGRRGLTDGQRATIDPRLRSA